MRLTLSHLLFESHLQLVQQNDLHSMLCQLHGVSTMPFDLSSRETDQVLIFPQRITYT